ASQEPNQSTKERFDSSGQGGGIRGKGQKWGKPQFD
ncbi:hypothetical protein NPIL_510041, partial [Nephila pilipes]